MNVLFRQLTTLKGVNILKGLLFVNHDGGRVVVLDTNRIVRAVHEKCVEIIGAFRTEVATLNRTHNQM